VNTAHREFLASEEWRQTLRDLALPFAFGDLAFDALGEDVVEIGPGPGLTTDLLAAELAQITAIELDEALASALRERTGGSNVEVLHADATAIPVESGRFSGAVSFTMMHHVPTAELQDAVLAEVCRVLRPGGLLVASDSVASDDLAAFHDDDIYNPIDPGTLEDRLTTAGYVGIEVRANPYAWRIHARRPAG
jgi:SAM-dependent methyltransferase